MARGRDWFLGALLLAALGIFLFFVASLFFGSSDEGFDLAAGRHLGLVKVEGVILESEAIVKEIERFGEDGNAAALIVRIDSPGGGVAASQEIYEAIKKVRDEGKFVTSRYYDVVNFARRVTVPGLYSWGFNDETCPPTSMYAAYNVITAPKRLMLAYDKGHQSTQEQVDDVNGWLGDELTGRNPPSAGRR
jgi:pimeloyl-ACP methyl ester carboxylesterase